MHLDDKECSLDEVLVESVVYYIPSPSLKMCVYCMYIYIHIKYIYIYIFNIYIYIYIQYIYIYSIYIYIYSIYIYIYYIFIFIRLYKYIHITYVMYVLHLFASKWTYTKRCVDIW